MTIDLRHISYTEYTLYILYTIYIQIHYTLYSIQYTLYSVHYQGHSTTEIRFNCSQGEDSLKIAMLMPKTILYYF